MGGCNARDAVEEVEIEGLYGCGLKLPGCSVPGLGEGCLQVRSHSGAGGRAATRNAVQLRRILGGDLRCGLQAPLSAIPVFSQSSLAVAADRDTGAGGRAGNSVEDSAATCNGIWGAHN